MNYKVNLGKVSIPVSKKRTAVIENFSVEVTDLSIVEMAGLVKELPAVIREIKSAIAEPSEPQIPSFMRGMPPIPPHILASIIANDIFGGGCNCDGCTSGEDDEEDASESSFPNAAFMRELESLKVGDTVSMSVAGYGHSINGEIDRITEHHIHIVDHEHGYAKHEIQSLQKIADAVV